MAGIAAWLTGIPMVLFVKGAMDTPLYDRVAVWLARRTVFLTEALKPDWLMPRIARSPADYPILPIGIDFSRADDAESRVAEAPPPGLVLEAGTVNFAFAGWLVPGKGVHVLIEAFARAVARCPACRLHILGASDDNAYVHQLHELVRRLVPANTIRFLGWRKDVLDVLAAVDSLVLPSFSEGVPRSIVEAMAFGKPVIATAVGGVPALLGDGAFGIVVAPDDSVALADALVRVASEPQLRIALGQKARAEARSRYGFDSHLSALWSTLDSACRKQTAITTN
jgi:glycosyltransferase involved in cell wall biosynthesis